MIKSSGMTVTPLRMAMTSPTVPTPPSQHHIHHHPQHQQQQQHQHQHQQHHQQHQQQKSSTRISNFSVASLLADTRPKSPINTTTRLTPTSGTGDRGGGGGATDIRHHTNELLVVGSVNLSQSSSSPRSQHDSSSNKNDNDRSQTPHSSIESDEYDSNQEDSIVDIEDVNNDSSELDKSSSGLLSSSALAGHVPIRPTPFSALAAAAAAWGNMGGGMPWPGARQMPPFGPPGLFPGQGFVPGQLNGGNYHIFYYHYHLSVRYFVTNTTIINHSTTSNPHLRSHL